MITFPRTLWPRGVRPPYRRLVVSVVVAPAVLSAILSLIVAVLAAMSEGTTEEAVAAGTDSAIILTTLVFIHTLTFGLAGVCLLWSLDQRSPVTWAAAGLVAGAVGGFVLAEIAMTRGGGALVVFSAVTSAALFMLIRTLAGIHDTDSER